MCTERREESVGCSVELQPIRQLLIRLLRELQSLGQPRVNKRLVKEAGGKQAALSQAHLPGEPQTDLALH